MKIDRIVLPGVSWRNVCKVADRQCQFFPQKCRDLRFLFMSPHALGVRILLPVFSREACTKVVDKGETKVWYGFSEEQVDTASWGPKRLLEEKDPKKRIVVTVQKLAPDNWVVTYSPPGGDSFKKFRHDHSMMLQEVFPYRLHLVEDLEQLEWDIG